MMKIFLIIPSQKHIYGSLQPPVQIHLGLAYIAAILQKNGYDVRIVDVDAEGLTPDKLTQRVLENRVDIVGISVATPTLNSALSVAKAIKKSSPSTITVFGGMHPSIMPIETIAHPEVDFVIKGEGELTFLGFLSAIKNKYDFSSVDGLVYKKENKAIENKPRQLIENLDLLPFPSRELFNNIAYTYPDSLYAKTAPVITSRGCPGRCTYCNAHSIFGRKFRARSAKNVVDEIETLIKKFGIKEIHIWDDNFVTDKQRVYRIKDEIKSRRIKVKFAFPNGIRADFLDAELIGALKEMGTYSIAIGVESANQEILNLAKKGTKIGKIIEVFELVKKARIETWAFFMFGLPGEDMASARVTIDFAKKLDPDIAKFHILKPYPGTEAYQFMLSNNFLNSLDYDNYGIHTPPVHHLDGLSSEDLVKLQKIAYNEFYFRPIKLLKQILRIKSFNRLKLNLKTAIGISKIIFKT